MGARRSTGTGRRRPLFSLLQAVVGSDVRIDYDHCLEPKYVVYVTTGQIKRFEGAPENNALRDR